MQLWQTHKHAQKYIYATRNSATTQEPGAKSQRRRLSRIASSPTCSGTIMPKPRLLRYALAHPVAYPTIAYLLACTFLLLFAGHQNELKCMHETLLDCTARSKKKKHPTVCSCVVMQGRTVGRPGGLVRIPANPVHEPKMSRERGQREWKGRERGGGAQPGHWTPTPTLPDIVPRAKNPQSIRYIERAQVREGGRGTAGSFNTHSNITQ